MISDQYISNSLIPSEAASSIKSQGLHVRQLVSDDFHKGFLRVLEMLTSVGSLTFGQFVRKTLVLTF